MVLDKNEVVLLLGSNIEPSSNISHAIKILQTKLKVTRISKTWETAAIGSVDANFLNLALVAHTSLQYDHLKTQILLPTESALGRIRSSNKNAARTIDLDIIIFNQVIIDSDLWNKAFIALPVADLYPDILHPKTKIKLTAIAKRLQQKTFAVVRDDIGFRLNCF